jgi:hypothetical protein
MTLPFVIASLPSEAKEGVAIASREGRPRDNRHRRSGA